MLGQRHQRVGALSMSIEFDHTPRGAKPRDPFGCRLPHLIMAMTLILAACSSSRDVNLPSIGMSSAKSTARPGYGPRVATGSAIPSGGGAYKLGAPYRIGGVWYVPHEDPNYDRTGVASWYGADFHGRRTANGEIYNMSALTAAHPTLPLPSYVTVTNLANNRTVLLRVNDRGPYVGGRLIDLSRAAAQALGYDQHGTAQVRVRYAGRAPLNGDDTRERQFLAQRSSGGRNAVAYAPPAPSYAPPSPVYAQPPPSPSSSGWSPDAYRRGLSQPAPSPKPQPSSWSSGWGLGSNTQ